MQIKEQSSLSATIWLGLFICGFPGFCAADAFSDNFISYRYGLAFKEPGVAEGDDISKNILGFQHFGTDSVGSNFLNIDALFSQASDPARNSRHGATEFYGVYRRDWSMSRILRMSFSRWSVVRDISLHMGVDLNAKDAAFRPKKRLLVVGPQVRIAVPTGFLNVAFNCSREWNHNGIVGRNVRFDPAFEMEAAWGMPFRLYGASWKFSGFFNYIAPKGRDGFGARTRAEILTRPELTFDLGELLGTRKGVFEIGAVYEYWRNKFGNDHAVVPGAFAKTPMVIVRIHI